MHRSQPTFWVWRRCTVMCRSYVFFKHTVFRSHVCFSFHCQPLHPAVGFWMFMFQDAHELWHQFFVLIRWCFSKSGWCHKQALYPAHVTHLIGPGTDVSNTTCHGYWPFPFLCFELPRLYCQCVEFLLVLQGFNSREMVQWFLSMYKYGIWSSCFAYVLNELRVCHGVIPHLDINFFSNVVLGLTRGLVRTRVFMNVINFLTKIKLMIHLYLLNSDPSVDPREKQPFHVKYSVKDANFNLLACAHEPVHEVRLQKGGGWGVKM